MQLWGLYSVPTSIWIPSHKPVSAAVEEAKYTGHRGDDRSLLQCSAKVTELAFLAGRRNRLSHPRAAASGGRAGLTSDAPPGPASWRHHGIGCPFPTPRSIDLTRSRKALIGAGAGAFHTFAGGILVPTQRQVRSRHRRSRRGPRRG